MQEITGAKPVRDTIFGRVKPFPKKAMRPSQSSQRSGGFHTPAPPRAAPGTATIFASMQQPADFFCNEILPGQPPAGGSISFARVVQQQRHDVEGVASAGAIPAASAISACKL